MPAASAYLPRAPTSSPPSDPASPSLEVAEASWEAKAAGWRGLLPVTALGEVRMTPEVEAEGTGWKAMAD